MRQGDVARDRIGDQRQVAAQAVFDEHAGLDLAIRISGFERAARIVFQPAVGEARGGDDLPRARLLQERSRRGRTPERGTQEQTTKHGAGQTFNGTTRTEAQRKPLWALSLADGKLFLSRLGSTSSSS